MASLQELLGKAQQGDKEALESLVLMFQPLILGCSREATESDREDLRQELNAKLIVLIRTYHIAHRERDSTSNV